MNVMVAGREKERSMCLEWGTVYHKYQLVAEWCTLLLEAPKDPMWLTSLVSSAVPKKYQGHGY